MQMDVYSCAEFDPQLIFDRLQSDFGLAKLEWKFIDREHGLEEIPWPADAARSTEAVA